ncbi:hypothetical protein [Saccharopolyspora antimicrobica]|nr:hypothetical protein [Saccharopolyspora antimicrobica]
MIGAILLRDLCCGRRVSSSDQLSCALDERCIERRSVIAQPPGWRVILFGVAGNAEHAESMATYVVPVGAPPNPGKYSGLLPTGDDPVMDGSPRKMRTSLRLIGVTAACATVLAIGSPAFAGGGKGHGKGKGDDHASSQAYGGNGQGGNGGLGVNVLSGLSILSSGDGGNASAGNGGAGVGGDATSVAAND